MVISTTFSVGLNVNLEHKYGHKDLIDMLHKFGFCSSYAEATKYRKSTAATTGVDVIDDVGEAFVQYQADNIDHASCTLDGYGSVHVMGQMATFTPAISTSHSIPRTTVTLNELKTIGHVNIIPQKDPKTSHSKIIYTKLGAFRTDMRSDKLDLMWSISFHFPKPQPMWSGCMQMLYSRLPHPGKSSDMFLPLPIGSHMCSLHA